MPQGLERFRASRDCLGYRDSGPYRVVETEGVLIHQIHTEDPWDSVAHLSDRVDKPRTHPRQTRACSSPIHAGGISVPQLRRCLDFPQLFGGRDFCLKMRDMLADHLVDSCFIRHKFENSQNQEKTSSFELCNRRTAALSRECRGNLATGPFVLWRSIARISRTVERRYPDRGRPLLQPARRISLATESEKKAIAIERS